MQVRVRMYRQGLGDCFLVTFGVGGGEKHMLIDCGTLGATTTGVTLADVVEDIASTTGGHLDLVVATHEHQDHVSGFRSQKSKFDAIAVDHVWLAWTENPGDALAQQIEQHENDLGLALAAASEALRKSASAESRALGDAVHDVLGFVDDAPFGASEFAKTVHEAMENVRTAMGSAPPEVRYLNPGTVETPDWLPGFRVFILGPPRSESALNVLGEHGSDELYGIASGLLTGARYRLSGDGLDAYVQRLDRPDQRSAFEANLPFDSRFRHDVTSPEARAILRDTYLDGDQDWRRIDDDWLHVAADLALQLDSTTNNTSLALAIERIADGRVLLFVADAQQGSWLSWHDPSAKWAVADAQGGSEEILAADLLARTVFYKVGHHASHNATASRHGLELMQRAAELTAFIPVDRAVALKRHPKGTWKMPAKALYRALLDRCEGRVVRSDLGWADDAADADNKPVEKDLRGVATTAEWSEWKLSQQVAEAAGQVTVGPLFVDYVLT